MVFARLPERGKVKTRLGESIGAEKALAVYEAMLHDVLQSIGNSTDDTAIEVAWAPTESANGEALRRAFGDHLLAMQTGANLGERLAMAFSERFFFHRAEKIIAIGVDDPTLTRETIDHAFGLLESCEWVIGPAHDGGYYLIGCRGASFKPAIFVDMPWGTDAVMRLTVQRIREWEQTLTILPAHYDIDVIDDLKRFASETRDSEAELPRLLRAWGMAA
jgi:uncharacterized protein